MSQEKYELLRSLTKDSPKPIQLESITGKVPEWLEGSLYRNGPGRYEYGNKKYNHLFDGHACVQKIEIKQGKIYFSNKLLETESYKKTLAENRLYPVFGTADACSNLFGRLKTAFHKPNSIDMDNVNVSIFPYAKKDLYALTETGYMCRIDPDTFDVKERLSISDYIKTSKTSIAHPHVLPDGSWINLGMDGSKPGYGFTLHKSSESGNICDNSQLIATVPSSHKMGLSYFHSFGITENYIVFLEQSLKLNFKGALLDKKSINKNIVLFKNVS